MSFQNPTAQNVFSLAKQFYQVNGKVFLGGENNSLAAVQAVGSGLSGLVNLAFALDRFEKQPMHPPGTLKNQ